MNILLGVTGSISAYKALDLMRLFVKEGHSVKIILSKGAQEFVLPQTFHYLGAEKVYHDNDDFLTFQKNAENKVLHVDLAKWADVLLIAPASANTISKLSRAEAIDLLTSVFLAYGQIKPIHIYPAMNTQMLRHPFVQENLDKLKSLPNLWVGPTETGELVCGDQGDGKLLDIHKIFHLTTTYNKLNDKKKLVLITCGATVSPIDPVRYMANPSSGLTGFYLAKKFLSEGYQVELIHGYHFPQELEFIRQHPHLIIIKANKVIEMKNEVENRFKRASVYISAAAICDYLFEEHLEKTKKTQSSGTLEYKPAPDILAEMIKEKTSEQIIISFAAETQTTKEVFLSKWNRKPVDLMIGNKVHSGLIDNQKTTGFKNLNGHYFFIRDGQIIDDQKLSKDELSNYLVKFVENIKR